MPSDGPISARVRSASASACGPALPTVPPLTERPPKELKEQQEDHALKSGANAPLKLSGPWTQGSYHDFMWSDGDEPHQKRRREILAKYPQIQSLFVREPVTAVYVLVFVSIQFALCWWAADASYGALLLCAYFVGGFVNHSLQLGAHELSHNLCWNSPTANKLTAIFANLPTGLASAITFGRYHYDHHLYQGYDGIDMDVPTEFEVKFFRSAPMKALWIFLQPFAYAFRPIFIKPKTVTSWEVFNWICAITFDVCIFYFLGAKSLTYLFTSTFLGHGLHPAAGHFIAEHFAFTRGQETYSYYGPMNYINFNVGYHVEHHDFPRVPWTKLPKLREIAKEYYDLPSYTSYLSVLYEYIMDPTMGPMNRIKRRKLEKCVKAEKKNYSFAIACACFGFSAIFFFTSTLILG